MMAPMNPPKRVSVDASTLLGEVARSLGSADAVGDALEGALQRLANAFTVGTCRISSYDRTTQQLSTRAVYDKRGAYGAPSSPLAESPLDQDQIARLADGRALRFAVEGADMTAAGTEEAASRQGASILCLPLIARNQLFGVLELIAYAGAHDYTGEEVELARALAGLFALALDRPTYDGQDPRDDAFYQEIIRTVGDGVLLVDGRGRCIDANPAFCGMLGYSRSEILGLRQGQLVSDKDLPWARECLAAIRAGESYSGELDLVRKGGALLPVEVMAGPVPHCGEIVFVGTFRDICARRRAEERLARRLAQFRALYQSSVQLTSQLETQQLLQDIARQAVDLVEASSGAVLLYDEDQGALTVTAVYNIPAPLVGRVVAPNEGGAGQAFASGEPVNVQDYGAYEHRARDLGLSFVGLLAMPLKARDRTVGVLAITDDRPDRVFTAEDEYVVGLIANYAVAAIVQSELFIELGQRATELAEANRELRELHQAKDDLLAMATHELQRPLTNARLNIELTLDGESQLTAQEREMLQQAMHSIDSESRLVYDLLYMARLGEPTGDTALRLDLRETINDAVVSASLLADRMGLSISMELPDDPVVIVGNPDVLETMVANLLANATKYTPDGGQIRAALRLDGSNTAVIEVQDTGVGIPTEHHERIFERFYRVQGAGARIRGGLGLGLAIVSRIVAYYGGKVTVASASGEGSTFTVRLPIEG